tara:strand:+ start:42 stop:305 length:264 start_codon:yes stop_codon:yes gene_type:complete
MRGEKVHKLDADQIYKTIRQLVGKVLPQGESNYDAMIYENLQILCEVTEKLIIDIDEVACENKDRQEHSMKRAGELACKFCEKHLAE